MTTRNAARVALAAYVAVLLFLLLQPRPEVAVGSVVRVAELLAQLPVVGPRVTGGRVEFLLNIAAFAPIPFLGRWAFSRVTWSEWVAWGFIGSVAVELIQGIFLDGRSAQFADIVANTAGSFAGAVAAVCVASHVAKISASAPSAVNDT